MRGPSFACYRSRVQSVRGSSRGHRRPWVLRDATDQDLGSLLILWRELMDVHTGSDERFALAEGADQRFLHYVETARSREDYRVRVAVASGRPIGFLICCVLPNSPVYRVRWIGYVNDVVVARASRGAGLGTALVEDAVAWMRQRGAESIEVYVAKTNVGGGRFWRSIGARDYLERLSLDLGRFGGRGG